MLKWAAKHCDAQTYEAPKVLRRIAHISAGAGLPLDTMRRATQRPRLLGACFAFQPVRIEQAERNVGTTLDFTHRSDELLRDFG